MSYRGHSAILGSNLIFLTSTLLLRQAGVDAHDGLVTMVLSDVVAAFAIFWGAENKVEKASTQDAMQDYSALFLWGICFISIYCLMILFSKTITIPHLILAESLAPFLALIFFRHVYAEWSFPLDVVRVAVGLGLIGMMAWSVWNDGDGIALLENWNLFLLIALLYTVSQSMARFLSKRRPALWAPPRLSMIAAVGIGGYMLTTMPEVFIHSMTKPAVIVASLVIGLLSPLNRGFFLYGLRHTPGATAALLINITIPMSMIFHMIETGKFTNSGFAMAVIYCLVSAYFAFLKARPRAVAMKNTAVPLSIHH